MELGSWRQERLSSRLGWGWRWGGGFLRGPGASVSPGLLLQDKFHEFAGRYTEHGPGGGVGVGVVVSACYGGAMVSTYSRSPRSMPSSSLSLNRWGDGLLFPSPPSSPHLSCTHDPQGPDPYPRHMFILRVPDLFPWMSFRKEGRLVILSFSSLLSQC